MRSVLGVLAAICGFLWMTSAQATVRVEIDLTHQSMNVTSSSGSYTWPVSTARSGYVTPRGTFAPYSLQTMHYSKKYHMSPMPYSIFFAGGYAIHGTYSVAQLGRPASHGCIRLSPGHAQQLFQMVKAEGASISIAGSPPRSTMFAKAHKTGPHYAAAQRSNGSQYYYGGQPQSSDGYYYGGGQNAGNGLAYAPARAHPDNVRGWQADPAFHW
jgi:hypothetical protein